MKRIGTHAGSFHADDALGVAMLLALYPGADVVRTRDPAIWATCDALVDVGGEHNIIHNRFDHHQKGFSKRRANGVPYAGSGLVWEAVGFRYVQATVEGVTFSKSEAIAKLVDEKLIQHADAVDSGVDVPGPPGFNLSGIIDTLNVRWNEQDVDDDVRFKEAVALAGTVLRNLVHAVAAEYAAAERVRPAMRLSGGSILVLDAARLPFDPVVNKEMPDVLFVVYPESSGQQYQVRVVPKVLGKYDARADLPAAWAGLRDADLANVTGVADAVFAHNGRFICGAGSLAGAVRMAELALAAL